MALPAPGSVEVDARGDHAGTGMSLELYLDRKQGLEETVLTQDAIDPVPLLQWIARDSTAIANRVHTWLTVDADVEVESEAEGTLTGGIS